MPEKIYHAKYRGGSFFCECWNKSLKPSSYADCFAELQWFPRSDEVEDASSDPFVYRVFKAKKNISQKLSTINTGKKQDGNVPCKDRRIIERIQKQALPILQLIQDRQKIMIKKIELKFVEESGTGLLYFTGVSDDFTVIKKALVHPPHTLYQGTRGYGRHDAPALQEMPIPLHKDKSINPKQLMKRFQCRGTFCQHEANKYKSNPQHLYNWKQQIENELSGNVARPSFVQSVASVEQPQSTEGGAPKLKNKRKTDDVVAYYNLMRDEEEQSPRLKPKTLEKLPDRHKFYKKDQNEEKWTVRAYIVWLMQQDCLKEHIESVFQKNGIYLNDKIKVSALTTKNSVPQKILGVSSSLEELRIQDPTSKSNKYRELAIRSRSALQLQRMYDEVRVCGNCFQVYAILQHPIWLEYIQKMYDKKKDKGAVDVEE